VQVHLVVAALVGRAPRIEGQRRGHPRAILPEAKPLEHADSSRPISRRDHQIRVAVRAHLAGIQPLAEHRALEQKRLDAAARKGSDYLDGEPIDRKFAFDLMKALLELLEFLRGGSEQWSS
jgi:hypothetical protein